MDRFRSIFHFNNPDQIHLSNASVSYLFSHGAQSLLVSKFIASIVSLLSDPTAPVRDAAFATLVEIYRHVGERVKMDLQRKYQVPPAKYVQA